MTRPTRSTRRTRLRTAALAATLLLVVGVGLFVVGALIGPSLPVPALGGWVSTAGAFLALVGVVVGLGAGIVWLVRWGVS